MAGKHFSKGKSKIHLIPEEAIFAIAGALGFGEDKYGIFNYRDGIAYSELANSSYRHLLKFMKGVDNDEESGLPHLWHLLANAAMLEYMRVNHPELDDRDPRRFKTKRKKNGTKSKKTRSKSRRS